jgi:hypothetical protein
MDTKTQHVREFLASMHPVRDALGELVRQLYRRQQVKLVRTYNPDASLSPDFGVSAELHNGAVVDFWTELRSTDSSWQVEYSVLRHDPDEDGSHTVVSFPTETVQSARELPKILLAAVESLRAASGDERLYA